MKNMNAYIYRLLIFTAFIISVAFIISPLPCQGGQAVLKKKAISEFPNALNMGFPKDDRI